MALASLIFKRVNAEIGGIRIDASVNEVHSNVAEPTDNSVENGANVSDHVDLFPFRLSMDGVISDTPLDFGFLTGIAGAVQTVASAFGASTRSVDGYEQLRKLMAERKPFKVVTGLKVYDNMVLTLFDVIRNARTGKAIHFHAEMQEIRIVGEEELSGPPLATDVATLAAPTRNLGQRILEQIQDISENKLFQGANTVLGFVRGLV